ncbi:MAG: hypothetical protein ACFFBD_24380 [Candidatus Hodarchaeota archaeon]
MTNSEKNAVQNEKKRLNRLEKRITGDCPECRKMLKLGNSKVFTLQLTLLGFLIHGQVTENPEPAKPFLDIIKNCQYWKPGNIPYDWGFLHFFSPGDRLQLKQKYKAVHGMKNVRNRLNELEDFHSHDLLSRDPHSKSKWRLTQKGKEFSIFLFLQIACYSKLFLVEKRNEKYNRLFNGWNQLEEYLKMKNRPESVNSLLESWYLVSAEDYFELTSFGKMVKDFLERYLSIWTLDLEKFLDWLKQLQQINCSKMKIDIAGIHILNSINSSSEIWLYELGVNRTKNQEICSDSLKANDIASYACSFNKKRKLPINPINFITGSLGSGKTVFLWQIWEKITAITENSDTPLILPIFIRLRDLDFVRITGPTSFFIAFSIEELEYPSYLGEKSIPILSKDEFVKSPIHGHLREVWKKLIETYFKKVFSSCKTNFLELGGLEPNDFEEHLTTAVEYLIDNRHLIILLDGWDELKYNLKNLWMNLIKWWTMKKGLTFITGRELPIQFTEKARVPPSVQIWKVAPPKTDDLAGYLRYYWTDLPPNFWSRTPNKTTFLNYTKKFFISFICNLF